MNETSCKNWLHLDLKGAIPSLRKMKEQLAWFKKAGFNGIVWEYDDRIPWKSWNGTWRKGYTAEEMNELHQECRKLGLEIIPLIQILGHLEWLLKYPEYQHLKENNSSSDICPQHPETEPLLRKWILEVIEMHPDSRFIHLGADETWHLGTCPICSEADKMELYVEHVSKMCNLVMEYGKRPIIWADVFYREKRSELFEKLPEGTILSDWQYSGVPPYPTSEFLLKGKHELIGASGAMIGWWEHCMHIMSEPQGRIDNVTGWRRWGKENGVGVIHTTWTRGASLWNIYGCWLGALPAYIAAGDPEAWEKHPWNETIRKISPIIVRNQIDELETAIALCENLSAENEIEAEAKRWMILALRYQRIQQELQIHRSTRRIIEEVSKFVGKDSSMFQHDCVDPFLNLLPKADQWELDARQFWKDNELSDEEEFMATHIGLIKREIRETLQ